jgi:AraC-like DNA-binding protein
VLASSLTQFPVYGQTTVAQVTIVVGVVTAAPPGSTWYGTDLSPGTMLVWAPGAEHAGMDMPGLRYVILAMPVHRLAETADRIEVDLAVPKRGTIIAPAPTDSAARVGDLLTAFDDPREPRNTATVDTRDAYHAVASMLSATRAHRTFDRRRSGNRRVTRVCAEHVEATGRLPSTSELCAVAHVSERKLREAFVSTFGLSSSQFFRLRALDRARIYLEKGPQSATVDEIALAAGFNHQGRFARYYADGFGELPSSTRRRGR